MGRANVNRPNSSLPEDWKAAGYSDSTANSEAYRGKASKHVNESLLQNAYDTANSLLKDPDPKVRVAIVEVLLKHVKKDNVKITSDIPVDESILRDARPLRRPGEEPGTLLEDRGLAGSGKEEPLLSVQEDPQVP